MAQTWTIYVSGQPTVERAVVHELEYHGSWMEEEYVSVNVRSATPITFQYGDHLYYRGVKFEINYDPNFIKKARSGSYGEGFAYDNIKLYPVSVKLKDIAFKDVVLNDPSAPANTLVYSSLGTFSFFAGSVEDLADRIQANLNRDYNGEWRVYTPYKARSIQRNGNIGAWGQYYNGDGSTIQGKTDINIECQNLSVMDALKMAYTSFDLSFYVTGKVIVIGGKPISADYDFEYGKGNGLYEIERTHDDSQRIVTKLYAYGSDKNLPLNYYANIGKKIKVQIAHKTKREITMGNPELVLWVNKEFTKALRDAFSPTYEVKLTLGHLSARFGVCGNTYTYAEEQDDDTLDHTTEYMTFWALSSDANALAMYNILVSGSQLYVTGVNINEMPADFIETPTSYNYDAALSITKLMLPGFPTESLFAWVVANGATHINYQTGQARWHGYDAIFSTDKSDPWIKSINAGNIGVREGTVEFDSSSDKEIFPTIEGTGFDEVAWCEQIEDNGHIDKELTFALQPMTVDGSDGDIEWDYGGVSISMKDGYCTGREFEVAEAKLNDNGDWELTMKRKKDDSLGVYFPYKSGSGNLYQIMGRGNHHGQLDGDHFVILGIPLPQSYVENAAAMLLEEALKHLAKVDHQSYTYLPRIDEIEMARQHDRAMASQGTITSIHDTICAGMQMQIDDDDLNVHYSPFIDNITIKENGNNGIPTYDVVLKDEKEMTMQERIQSQIDGGKDAIINSLSPEGEWLSKVSDDTAQGMITFLRGLQVGERFVTGLLGEGGVFRVEDDGTTYIEADKLYIRMKAYFDSVEIREYHHTGGNRIASVAGARCCRVEWIDSQGNVLEKTQANLSSVVKFRCYFMGNDGEDEVRNNWVVGDLAYCHITTVEVEQSDNPEAKGLNMRHYWRKVVGRNATGTLTVKGEHWIDLSNVSGEYQSGSDVPVAQDDIIQLGNVSDGDRQGAIIEFVTGADAPSYQIFQHINSFSLNEKNFVNLGYDSQNNTAQAFIGNPDKSTYLWYHNVTVGGQTFPRLEIKANVQFTSPETSYGTQDLNAFISAVTGDINNIHDQIDGTIETWFYDGEPTLNNLPASQWTSSTDKDKHLGDLYYDNQTGYGYRFAYDESVTPAVYKWIKITDVDVVKALADAAKAQDTADHKRRVFVAQPAPVSPKNYVEYDIGDLWVNATNPSGYTGETDEANHKYNNDCLRCIVAKPVRNAQGEITDGTFNINDWQLASKYTDDTELKNFLGNYEGTAEDLKQQIDKKAETWYQDEDPSLDWYVVNPQTHEVITDVRSEHVGDLWYCTAPVSATPPAYYDAVHGGNKTWQYKYNESTSNYYWAYQNVPVAVFDRIDGKAQLFVQIPNVANPKDDGYCYRKDDMWILEDDNVHSPEKAGELMVATQSSTSYNSLHWVKKLKYTDDLDAFVARYVQDLTGINTNITNAQTTANNAATAASNAQSTADNAAAAAAAADYLRQALTQATDIVGGLVLATTIGLRDSSNNVWAGINGAYQASETDTGYKGHGIAAWYGGGMIDGEVTDISGQAKSLFRFDGSGYVAGKNISWDASGNVTIQGYSINATTLQMGGSNVATESMLANYVTLATDQTITGAKTFSSAIKIGDIYIGYDSTNNALKVYKMTNGTEAAANFYATGGVSALGSSSSGGGGGINLNEPLLSINQAGLSAPTTNGSVLVYSSGWKYSSSAGIFATSINVAGTASAAGFSATGKDNTYVLLAGGGTKLLSEIGGGSGSVNSITIGSGGTNYTPDANGIITLPAYPSTSGFVSGITFNGGNPLQPISGNVSLGGLTTVVKVGSTSYNVSATGVVELPAYPTVPTKVSELTNDSGYLTDITSSMVTTALGYTPAASSDLTNYLPKSGGTMTGNISWGTYSHSTTNGWVDYNQGSGIYILDSVNSNTGAPNAYATGLHVSGIYWFQLCLERGNDNLCFRGGNTGGVTTGGWKTVAFIDSNVASATKLQTARSLWGQSFDGSADVNGNMSLYTLTSETNITLTADGSGGDVGSMYMVRGTGGGLTFGETNRDIIFRTGSGSTTAAGGNERMRILSNGNIGIGTTSPAYTLDVNGTFYTSGNSSIGGNIQASSFIKTNGTSSQFLKADGSVDSNTYALSSSLSDYLPKSGGTMTGSITWGRYYGDKASGWVDYNAGTGIYVLSSTASNTGAPNAYATGLHVSGIYWFQLCLERGNDNLCFRGGNTGGVTTGGWKTVAFIDSNVASATKLETSRTIWGQSFDGTANVSGTIYLNENLPQYFRAPTNGSWRGGMFWDTAGNEHCCFVAKDTRTRFVFVTGSDIASWANGTFNNSITSADMIIGSDGVGIGTKSPAYKLDVVGNAQFGSDSTMKIRLGTTSSSAVVGMVDAGRTSRNVVELTSSNILYFGGGTGAAGYQTTFRGHKMMFVAGSTTQVDAMFISSAGKVMIGSSSAASYMLHVTGDIYATGGITALSDAREKNVIGNTNLTVEDIAMMKAVNYRWKDGRDNVQHVGSIAQDWQRVLPEVVMRADDEKGTLSLQYGVAALVSSIVTARKVVDHERRIAELERENRELKEKLKIA